MGLPCGDATATAVEHCPDQARMAAFVAPAAQVPVVMPVRNFFGKMKTPLQAGGTINKNNLFYPPAYLP